MKTTRTFNDIVNILESRKSAAVKKAETPSCVPEKDPNDTGTVKAPHEPDSDLSKSQMSPSSPPNADSTPTLSPPTVDKTVNGVEPCSINMKIATTASKIREFVATTAKKAVAEKTVPAGSPSLPTGQAEVKSIPAKPTEKGAPKDPPTGPITETAAATGGGSKKADAPGEAKDQVKGDKDPTEKGEVKVKSDPISGLPKGEDVENTNKMAGEDLLQFDPSYHFKIASVILATEEGRQLAENLLLQSLGQEAAVDIVKAAAIMEQQAEDAATYEASGAAYADQLWAEATPAERENIVKIASIHEYQKTRFTGENAEMLKAAYDAGAEAAAGQMDGASSGAGAPLDAAADEAAPAPGGDDAGQEVSEEDIVQVLQQLVQSGELTPEVAEQLLTQLVGGGDQGDAGAAPGGASADGAGTPPPDVAGPAEKAAALVDAILRKEAAAAAASTVAAIPAAAK